MTATDTINTTTATPLDADELDLIDAYWRAANYLSVGQIYLLDNPLLREPLQPEHVKPRLLGHWGTTPGPELHLRPPEPGHPARDLDAIYITGPGHGGPGDRRERLPRGDVHRDLPRDHARRGGHAAAVPPVLASRAASRATSRPRPRARSTRAASSATRCRTRTAPRSTTRTSSCAAWSATARPRPARSPRAGTRTSSSTRRATAPSCRSSTSTATRSPTRPSSPGSRARSSSALLEGYGHTPYFVEGDDPARCTSSMAATLDEVVDEIRDDPAPRARRRAVTERPRWPMIVLARRRAGPARRRSTAYQVEGTWRSHQVPLGEVRTNAEHRQLLEEWLRSYRPEELFDDDGRLRPELAALPPTGTAPDERQPARQRRRCSCGPGPAGLPRLRGRRAARRARPPQRGDAGARRVPPRRHAPEHPDNFRLFGPDETASNRLGAGLRGDRPRAGWPRSCPATTTSRPTAASWRSSREHLCQGWLEGYLLTGRHGLFNCYEAFIHIIDSMFNQHAKWLKVTRELAVARARSRRSTTC